MARRTTTFLAIFAATLLQACGGGGSAGPIEPSLSSVQSNYLQSTLTGTYSGLSWRLPASNVAPVDGTDYLLATTYALSASPENGEQTLQKSTENLTTSLTMPLVNTTAERILKNGKIEVFDFDSVTKVSFVGANIETAQYAQDGSTLLFTKEFDDWSQPQQLSGTLASSDILRQFYGFGRLNIPTYFNKTVAWRPGSSYVTRKQKTVTEIIEVHDWNTRTYDSSVDPWSGTQTTIETMFNYVESAVSGVTVRGVTYTFADGAVTTKEGVRMWVATTKQPTSVSAADSYVTFMELNSKIYLCTLTPALTRIRFIDGIDTTQINDYNIRFNAAAVQSIKDAVNF